MHNILTRKFVDTIIAVINGTNRTSGKCIGCIFSIRCKTWSAALCLPDAKGNPPNPPRSWPDRVLGKTDANGNIPSAIAEANDEPEHAVEIGTAIWNQSGFVMNETRRPHAGDVARRTLRSMHST
eukprot:4419824-Prymnesium_polylepis.1